MSDVEKFTKRAVEFMDAAKAAARRGGEEWTEPDFAEVQAIANLALNLAMNEERLGSVPLPQVIVEPGSVRHYLCGWHLPGHVDEHGAAVVCMLPPGVRRNMPPDALAVALLVTPAQEAEFRKTYPGG